MSEYWDQESEHRHADFLHMLERMQRDFEERSIETAESALTRTSTSDVPMPMTAHPALERCAEAVRSADARRGAVRIPIVRSMTASFDPQSFPTSVASTALTFSPQKICAPAPFVGDPHWEMAAYVWRVWTDDYGRHITTDSELVWR